MDTFARAGDHWLRTGSGAHVRPGFDICSALPDGAPPTAFKWLWHVDGLVDYANWLNGGPP